MRDGEVHDPEVLGDAIKEMFTSQKLPRTSGSGSPTSASPCAPCACRRSRTAPSSTPRFASRPRTTSRCRSTGSVLDWQVIPPAPGHQGEGIEVVGGRGPPRDARGADGGRPPRRAAPGRHRPLELRPDPRARRPGRGAAGAVGRGRAGSGARRDALLPPRRHHQPRRRPRVLLRLLAACSASGSRASPRRWSPSGSLNLEHARQWLLHVGLADPVDEVSGDPRWSPRPARRSPRASATLVDELRRSLEYYAAFEDAVRVDDVVVAGPGTAIPGLVERLEQDIPVPLRGRRARRAALGRRPAPRGD